MNKIEVCRVPQEIDFFSEVEKFKKNKIDNVNWPDRFPYAPDVKFVIGCTDENIFLKFFVDEKSVMAKVAEDNGEVWTDSCVEFFISFDESGYYNFEFNCIGTMLLGFRKQKDNAVHAGKEILNSIYRSSTLGNKAFDEKKGDCHWELSVKIPCTAFFKHDIKSFSGIKAKANFYKCGDNLSEPHFLSWNPIESKDPNFHLESFFGELDFK